MARWTEWLWEKIYHSFSQESNTGRSQADLKMCLPRCSLSTVISKSSTNRHSFTSGNALINVWPSLTMYEAVYKRTVITVSCLRLSLCFTQMSSCRIRTTQCPTTCQCPLTHRCGLWAFLMWGPFLLRPFYLFFNSFKSYGQGRWRP